MTRFVKPGRVVLMTNGRYAGHKAVIVQSQDAKTKERKYGTALVAGIKKYPKRVVRGMSKRRIQRRSRVGVFLRIVNQKHFFATRYNMDLSKELRGRLSVADTARKTKSRRLLQKVFQARHNDNSNRWFFQKLRF
jgi:large subunit ribosomal protein L27e